ncbi:DNA methyltransferase [Alienimonas sp. DA493]|uniref:DNA methyltransferase n=1 Tax=Alienimonas sp. DA493 TaxID=3373605 RepID=UPI0037552F9F
MAVKQQAVTDRYAVYCGDCVEVMREVLADRSIDFSVYSPPFAGLYQYSSDERDMSNCVDREEFFEQYGFCIEEIARVTKPGRISAVHCMDIPLSNAGCDAVFDLPGRIIREHEARGFDYAGRRVIWKEPLAVRNRTMMKSLHHATLCDDATRTSIANADYLLMFRRAGENAVPVRYETGLTYYAGETEVPPELLKFRGMEGDQKKNLYSQWIWRRYASSVWDDVRIDRVLPYRAGADDRDEKHVHPLQLDVIERAVQLISNPGEVGLTPFGGVMSEPFGMVLNGRKAVGIELHPGYFAQGLKNLEHASRDYEAVQNPLFADLAS